jgi:hypothetical protein
LEGGQLRNHLTTLRAVSPDNSPVVSCYLTVADGDRGYRNELNRQVRAALKPLEGDAKREFWEVLGHIEVFLATGIGPDTLGVAIFARSGSSRFFLPLQFPERFSNRVSTGSLPFLTPLVELLEKKLLRQSTQPHRELALRFGTGGT